MNRSVRWIDGPLPTKKKPRETEKIVVQIRCLGDGKNWGCLRA